MTPPAGAARGASDAPLPVASVTAELLGTRYNVGATSPETGRVVASLLEPFSVPTAPAAPSRRLLVVDGCAPHESAWCVHRGGTAVHRGDSSGDALAWVLAELNADALDAFDGFAVHAGVVASGGEAIAFPAPSGAGKTTLTAAAVVAGFDYVSDEALCVDYGSHAVVPYPRALGLSPWSRHHAGLDAVGAHELCADEVFVTPAQLGVGPPHPGLRLAHVVVPVRRPGPPALVGAHGADAMAMLLAHSFNHFKRPRDAFELCAALARQVGTWRLELSDPSAAAALLADRLGGGPGSEGHADTSG